MVATKKWTLLKNFNDKPKTGDFKLVQEEKKFDLKDGEVLCEAVYLSVDPYMRMVGKFPADKEGVLPATQVAKITESKNKKFPVGTMVYGELGWRSHTVVTDTTPLYLLPPIGDQPASIAMGALGMPGMTAYFGVVDALEVKPGDVVVVSGAAGAVGSVVGQMVKIQGGTVIGFAGSDEKCKWVKELGFDHVFNYKKTSVLKALDQVAPNGVDSYFDNVGGQFAIDVLKRLKALGRFAVCGSISTYNKKYTPDIDVFLEILAKQLKVKVVFGWNERARWPQGQTDILRWISEGKLKYRETVFDGFENMAKAFVGLFEGTNTGKAIIKV